MNTAKTAIITTQGVLMRGSIYYQTSLLAKAIFSESAVKAAKLEPYSVDYLKVSSFKTMETYRRVWNNLGLHVKAEYGIKDFECITSEHIESYMLQKIDISPSRQYMEKISSALGKLEVAIMRFRDGIYDHYVEYNFDIRKEVLKKIRKEELVYDGYHDRAYLEPLTIIEQLQDPKHKLAASMQHESGARFEGIGLIKTSQKLEKDIDPVTKKPIYKLETQEKGGKRGFIYLTEALYKELKGYLQRDGVFKIDYQQYAKAIRDACKLLGIDAEGTHGFRWAFAQSRIWEYQEYGYSYLEALQGVSTEMKHNRINISLHYIGY